ncbi:hypothetical protein B0H16DRAFT_1479068 [Mycena metata]|uniref:Uncharacterized protein n=1 Tax=Mycena metata TaxID=1033252 RepID=A0AAD7ME13_9AGAR|nr:hypothetical protein B0H16DRAFT_1479068 [Mycena metata]
MSLVCKRNEFSERPNVIRFRAWPRTLAINLKQSARQRGLENQSIVNHVTNETHPITLSRNGHIQKGKSGQPFYSNPSNRWLRYSAGNTSPFFPSLRQASLRECPARSDRRRLVPNLGTPPLFRARYHGHVTWLPNFETVVLVLLQSSLRAQSEIRRCYEFLAVLLERMVWVGCHNFIVWHTINRVHRSCIKNIGVQRGGIVKIGSWLRDWS